MNNLLFKLNDPCYSKKKQSTPIYLVGSKFDNRNLKVCENWIDFSSDCKAEKTTYEMLLRSGFDLNKSGTTYVIHTAMYFYKKGFCPIKMSDYYKPVAEKFGTSVKAVEMSIYRAISAIPLYELSSINTMLGSEIIAKGKPVSAGNFLSKLITKILMLKSHAVGETYFA